MHLLQLLLVVVFAGGWQVLFVLHDLFSESLARITQELAGSSLEGIAPVRVLDVLRPWNEAKPFRLQISKVFELLVIRCISERDSIPEVCLGRLVKVKAKGFCAGGSSHDTDR